MKDERNERAKRIGWVSLVVDVAVRSHFAHLIASMLVFQRLARSPVAGAEGGGVERDFDHVHLGLKIGHELKGKLRCVP